MKGLLLKDLYTLKKPQLYITILIIFITSTAFLFAGEEMSTTAEMLLMLFPILVGNSSVRIYLTEQQEKWDSYSITFPVSRKTYVLEKYIFGLILTVTLWFLSSAVFMIKMKNFTFADSSYSDFIKVYFFRVVMTFALNFFTMSFTFPIGFRFGSGGYAGICILCGMAGGICAGITDTSSNSFNSYSAGIVLLAVSIVLYFLSYLISVNIYKRKEL